MKQLVLTALLVFTGFTIAAQDVANYSSGIRLQFGGAFPVGNFSSDDFEEDYPAFAMSGPLLQLSYNRTINPRWAAGATFALRRNPFNLDKFADPTDKLVLNRESEPWQSVFTLADVYYRMQTGDKLFYLKGSVGAAFNRRAKVTIATPYGTIDHKADRSTALAYGLHVGLKQNFDRWSIGLETGILSGKPIFEMPDAQGNKINYKQPMTTVNAGLFAAYAF
ncbi:hypothetical protein H7F15_15375 [Pontibacter sp. Tf4]|uniref:hypothetical protein n=1 Tax=Pontibacter sp. Tf4 TaxID=2761620 RepID=UPI001627C6E1|nr:hypothetical protein [Pontibacter sp. Tf4]MBB6612427.1 hypothetical protein [Pontibacter sp. Tf4]